MGMFGPKMGTYWTASASDSRFSMTWRKEGLVTAGIPEFITEWAENKAKELGLEKPPEDLQVGFIKD